MTGRTRQLARQRPRKWAAGAAVVLAAAPTQAQCQPQWSGLKRGANWATTGIGVLTAGETGTGEPAVVLGGGFNALSGAFTNILALYDGKRVRDLGGGISQSTNQGPSTFFNIPRSQSRSPLPPGLYVGGNFRFAGGMPVNNLARWSSGQWHDVGAGISSPSCSCATPQIKALAAYARAPADPLSTELYVGGSYEQAGPSLASPGLAAWNGATWSSVGGGLYYNAGVKPVVEALEAFDDDGPGPRRPGLYVGGGFLAAGGQAVNHIARWDGAAWEALGQGMAQGGVMTMCTFDEDGEGPGLPSLFVGGPFKITASPDIWYIARWNGQEWSHVGPIFNGAVLAMTVFDDDGPGPNRESLFAGGVFTHIFTTPYQKVARWDGAQWHPLGFGLSGFGLGTACHSLGVFDEDGPGPNPGGLYVGGLFYYAGEEYTHHIARWGCPQAPERAPCDPDCDNDGILTLADFGCFINNFARFTPYADMNADGQWNLADFGLFQTRFATGCP